MLLQPEGPARITEHGKRWLDRVLTLAAQTENPPMMGGITSGVSQYGMAKLIDHINGKTSFTLVTPVFMALATTAPTSTTTGTSIAEAGYTGYARVSLAAAAFNAATAATPSVATNNGAITFGACTAGTSTLLGFMIVDASTVGNSLWYGTLTSTVISTTQTPPTVATTAMSLSMTGT